jgi:hypothetical protein
MPYTYHDYPALRISSNTPTGISSFGNPHHDDGLGEVSSKKKVWTSLAS